MSNSATLSSSGDSTRGFLFEEIQRLLEPLFLACQDKDALNELLADIGWDLTSIDGFPVMAFEAAVATFRDAYIGLGAILANPPQSLDEFGKAVDTIKAVFMAIRELSDVFDNSSALKPPNFERLVPELLNLLACRYLKSYHPSLFSLAMLIGIVKLPPESEIPEILYDSQSGEIVHFPSSAPEIRFERIIDLLTDPVQALVGEYLGPNGLATESEVSEVAAKLFPLLSEFLSILGVATAYGFDPSGGSDLGTFANDRAAGMITLYLPLQKEVGIGDTGLGMTVCLSPRTSGLPGLVIVPFGELSHSGVFGDWKVDVSLTADVGAFAVGRKGIVFDSAANATRLEANLAATKLGDNGEAWLIGGKSGTRVEIGSIDLVGNASLDPKTATFGILARVKSARVVILPGDGDGFLQSVLPKDGLSTNFDFSLGWSNKKGLCFDGSADLTTRIPIHRSILGFLTLESLDLSIDARNSGIETSIGASVQATLGPVKVAAEGIGIKAILDLSQKGNLGFADLSIGFKPPTGVGVSVDAGPICGGGFLSYDSANGRYSGILQLQVQDISLKAIGLLDTKLPGGVPGYSFLIIITAEFSPGIQLGWGFTLNGVGGLAGIQRTVVVEALQDGLRKHSLDNILFPKNPVADASQIISDLQTIFPPKPNRYVFGPMALIGWGMPTMVEAEIGILIDLPDPVRIIILGQIHATIPTKDAAIIELNLDALGLVDFSKKLLAVDATLHDSRIAGLDASGDMALRLLWGDQPNFALALGGFNPNFNAPTGFPQLRRITLALGTSDNPRVTLQAYLALTSNTVQFGAKAEVYAAAGSFNIYGWLGFDALFTFTPFSFRADLSGGVALRHHRHNLASVHLDGHLTGPSQWHVWGKASLSCLLGDISVPFDARFGQAQTVQPPTKDPWTLLESAIQDPHNWSGSLPPTVVAVATPSSPPSTASAQVSSPSQTSLIQIDPAANLAFHQKVLPLDRTLTKFGEAKLAGANKYTIAGLSVNGGTVETDSVKDFFAPAQFIQMSDSDRLSHSSFESMQSGVKMIDTIDFDETSVMSSTVEYETIIIDPKAGTTTAAPPYTPTLDTQLIFHKNSAVALSALRTSGLRKFSIAGGVQKLAVLEEEKYVITSKLDGSIRNDIASPIAKSEALQILLSYATTHPTEKANLQVMPVHEVSQFQPHPEASPVLTVPQIGGIA